jgi:tape measure domain-containing protein
MANRSIEYIYKLIDQYSATIKKMAMSTKAFQNDMDKAKLKAEKMSKGIGDSIKRFALVGVAALGAGFAFAIKKASEMENSLVSYTTLLKGNSEAAKKLVDDLQILGAETPFEFKDLSNATTMLMGFGAISKDTAVPTLRMLGDLSQGSAEHLQGVALAYGQIAAAGKADQMDIRQLINNQVPILEQLAKQWGVTVGEARKMIPTKGTFAEINKAMIAMTSTGGMFEGGMLRASKTFTGLWSTFLDSIGITAAGLGESLLPAMKELLIWITKISTKVLAWVQNHRELIKTKLDHYIRIITISMKAFWAVITFVYNILKPFIPLIIGIIIAFKAYAAILVIINLVMMANPINLWILAIGILIGVILTIIVHWKSIKAALLTGAKAIGDFFVFIWNKIKEGFVMAFDIVKKIFFTFADYILTVYGTIAKVILGLVGKIGKAIGLNVSGIDDMIKGISDVQASVREKSFFGSVGESKNNELGMNGKEKAQVNVKTDLSVYTEKGMSVAPFQKRKNLGYQMAGSYVN